MRLEAGLGLNQLNAADIAEAIGHVDNAQPVVADSVQVVVHSQRAADDPARKCAMFPALVVHVAAQPDGVVERLIIIKVRQLADQLERRGTEAVHISALVHRWGTIIANVVQDGQNGHIVLLDEADAAAAGKATKAVQGKG